MRPVGPKTPEKKLPAVARFAELVHRGALTPPILAGATPAPSLPTLALAQVLRELDDARDDL